MQNLKFRLPPINSVVAFEAAGRLQSITRAARELSVTREAVSRQIRLLEDSLGIRLFTRDARSVALTPAGKELLEAVAISLEGIASCADRLRKIEPAARVSVTATVALSSFWLTPRLRKFWQSHPNVDIRIRASDAYRNLLDEGIDVGLWYGDGQWPGVKAIRLFDIDSFPVCSPDYLVEHPGLTAPMALLQHRLLHLEGTQHSMENWDWWLTGHRVPLPSKAHFLSFDNYANVIQAAVTGQGVALGYSTVIDGLLERGDLVKPMAASLSKGLSVYVVLPSTVRMTAETRAFCDWMIAEAREAA